MELEGYSRPTCNRQCASSNDALTIVGVVNKLDRRRVLLTTRSFCPGKRFQSPEFVAKFLIFTGTQISLQHSVGHVEGSSDAKTSSIRPDKTPDLWRRDTERDRHSGMAYYTVGHTVTQQKSGCIFKIMCKSNSAANFQPRIHHTSNELLHYCVKHL